MHPVHRQKEGRSEVRPERFAIEIGEMKSIPRRTHLMAGERIPRRMSVRNQRTVQFFNGDSVRRGHCTQIRLPKWIYGRTFFVQPGRHTARSWSGVRYHSFQRKEAPSADNSRLDFLVVPPAIDATMGIKNS